MKLKELVDSFLAEQRTIGNLLEPERVLALGVAALQFYAGCGHTNVVAADTEPPPLVPVPVESFAILIDPQHMAPTRLIPQPTGVPIGPQPFSELTADADLSPSDWMLVRTLFIFYVEREQAILLEATRVMGADVYGRDSSSIQQDISAYEADLPQKAYCQPVITV